MSMHHDWLSLIEISGPFLAVPVLKEAFPQGLEALDVAKRQRLRQAYDEWQEAMETSDPRFDELHAAWIEEVLARGLELDEDGRGDVLKRRDWCAANVVVDLPEHGVHLSPDFVVVGDGGKPLLLIQTHGPEVDLEATQRLDGWASTPAERMVALCRVTGCRLGLVTNGERWMLVDAPVGVVTTFASWYARLWGQEPVTLQAFVTLLGLRRFFVDESERLPALLDRSLKYQDEVTEALGEQVRRAVEVLIQALDRADLDRDRTLLREVSEAELYEAALTVMMRLVFLLCAEERGLLLLGDPRYEAYYAVSTLRMQLRAEPEEILERRHAAWSRLLAVFRAVYGGIEHENLRLPALGGSLFDPDRFPFLEGRAKGSHWRSDPADPLPIDDRTVLLLLEAIQTFDGRTLSYRALDVEQIGYVYEGLLERTVKRTIDVTLELDATKSAQSPWITLAELESARLDGTERLVALLRERSGSSESRIRNDLARPVDEALAGKVLTACHGDSALAERIRPYAHLLRMDPWGYPLIHPAGAYVVTTGSDRRETGTHYTPKSLTEAIVAETLTPVAYVGPAEGKPRAEWELSPPGALLDLNICDPAMGSGAFLVQACRWLAERLVEAWARAEAQGHTVGIYGRVAEAGADVEPLPRDLEERTLVARRLVAERCLYGVDLNPLAVELAKLSLWLVTLAKGRPFGFLDHALRCGDSLLGIHRLDQLTHLRMSPRIDGFAAFRSFASIERAVHEAIELRQRLRQMPIRDIRDVEVMAHLDAEARRKLETAECLADAFIGEVFATGGSGTALENALAALAIEAERTIAGDEAALAALRRRARERLATDLPPGKPPRRPLHWPLVFPEVFVGQGGFDAIVGNPPFLGGKRISTVLGTTYNTFLAAIHPPASKNSDLVAHFFRRAFDLLREGGGFGLLAVNTIAEGDTRQGGLEWMVRNGAVIHAAYPNEPWPGKAAVVTSRVHVHKGEWHGERTLLGRPVPFVSAFLSGREEWSPKRLKANEGMAFVGSIVNGMGFVLTPDEAERMLDAEPRNADVIFPYLNGEDLNSDPEQRASRWVINFWDWSEERARQYDLPWRWIEKRVYPERLEKSKEKSYRNIMSMWWLHWNGRPGLYHAIGHDHSFERHPEGWSPIRRQFGRILAITRVSKTLAFSFVGVNSIFSEQVVVFSSDRGWVFALLQSNLHAAFTWQHASRLKNDLRYSPTDTFEPFPFPNVSDDERLDVLDNLGDRFHSARADVMRRDRVGLTKLYNRFHDPAEHDARIEELRELHREMDLAVARAYGWDDLDLGHGFHEVPYLPENDRVRFTISETARVEVLRRLSELNRQRYEEEVAQGLHGPTAGTTRRTTRTRRTVEDAPTQSALAFDQTPASAAPRPAMRSSSSTQTTDTAPAHAILDYLRAHPGWHAKSDIIAATGLTDGQWNAAVADLVATGRVERQGERRGARYRAIESQISPGENQ